jgi:glycosyltransferase involved in cell wall biosynthesis
MIKLSILICTIPGRENFIERLLDRLSTQLTEEIEMISDGRKGISIGEKRNGLLQRAKGEYVSFIDDDDLVSHDYIKLLLDGINKGVDCCSLKGIITEDGLSPLIFEHSLKYKIWRTVTDSQPGQVRYERPPNHLNCIMSSIAKQFKFPEKNHGEDHEWSNQIAQSGLIKTEHAIEETIYYYEYRSKK